MYKRLFYEASNKKSGMLLLLFALISFALVMFYPHLTFSATDSELHRIGVIDVTASPYNCDPTGVRDSTTGLQQAIIDGYFKDMAVLLKPGTYKVTDTLILAQDRGQKGKNGHHLIGSTAGENRPKLFVPENTEGFGDEDNPKPVVYIYTLFEFDELTLSTYPNTPPPWSKDGYDGQYERAAMGFNNVIRGIDIEVGTGNEGAIGLKFAGAQQCATEDLMIKMNSGFAGMCNSPGVNSSQGNIVIEGGKYGIWGRYMEFPTFQNITLKNQTEYAIYKVVTGQNPCEFIGFKIIKENAPAVMVCDTYNRDMSESGGNLTFVDGSIEFEKPNGKPAIDNTVGRSVVLKNVYFKNADYLIKSRNKSGIEGGAGWRMLDEYAYTIAYAFTGCTLIDGVIGGSDEEIIGTVSSEQAPFGLEARYCWDPDEYYSPDYMLDQIRKGDPRFYNILDHPEVKGDGINDDRKGIQWAIDNYEVVLVPKGEFTVSDTIVLGENTHLIGVANDTSRIGNAISWLPTKDNPGTIITTVDSASAKTKMSFIMIYWNTSQSEWSDWKGTEENDWFTGMHWKAGRYSSVRNTYFRPLWGVPEAGGNDQVDWLISGNGGGRWYGTGLGPDWRSTSPGNRYLVVHGTTEPLMFFNLNIERCNGDWMSEIKDSQNVAVLGCKGEGKRTMFIHNSDNIIVTNRQGGQGDIYLKDNTRVWLANSCSKRADPSVIILEEVFKGETHTIMGDKVVSLMKQGNVDLGAFDIKFGMVSELSSETNQTTIGNSDLKTDKNDKKVTVEESNNNIDTTDQNSNKRWTGTLLIIILSSGIVLVALSMMVYKAFKNK